MLLASLCGFSQTTGWAGTATNDATIGDVAWTNVNNATTSTDDGVVATATVDDNQTSQYLKLTNFGINITNGDYVSGIVVNIEWSSSHSSIKDLEIVLIKGGVIQTHNKATLTAIPNPAEAVTSYGGQFDTWGLGLSEADVEAADFGVAIRVQKDGTAGNAKTADIDRVSIDVYHNNCSGGGGGCMTIGANNYTVCPGNTEIITFTLTEGSNSCIPGGTNAYASFKFNNGNYKFLDNANLTVTIDAAGDLNEVAPPSVSVTSELQIDVYNIRTSAGGPGENQLDAITVTAEIMGVATGADDIVRCQGDLSTLVIDDGDIVASFSNTGGAMTYVTTVVTQASVDDVAPNSLNNEILGFNVSTTGSCPTIDLTEIVFATTNSTNPADINNATVYYTGATSTFSAINAFGNIATPNGTETINGVQSLLSGDNFFWIAYDLATGSQVGDVVDAVMVSVTADGNSYAVGSPDPAGTREIAAFLTIGSDQIWDDNGVAWNITNCGDPAVAGFPGSGSNAVICNGTTITLDSDEDVKNLTIDGILDLGNNNLTVHGSITFVSGSILLNNGNLIMAGANKQISGDGTITSSGTGYLEIDEDIGIAAAASITVTGTSIYMDAANKTLTNNGTLVADGFTGSGGGSNGRIFKNASGATLKLGGNCWDNKLTMDFDDGNNTLEFTATQTIPTNSDPDNLTYWNIIISGGTVTFPNKSMSVKGNYTNNSAVDMGMSSFDFNGGVGQQITGSSNTTFYNLSFNNANGTTLGNDITISNTLNLTNGAVTTGVNILIISNTTPANLVVTNGFIYGNLRRYFDNPTSNTYFYPIAKGTAATDKCEFSIIGNALNGVTYIDGSVSSITEAGNNVDGNLNTSEDGTSITNFIEDAEWTITPNVQPTSGNYGVRLYVANLSGLSDDKFTIVKRPEASTSYADWSTEDGATTIPETGTAGRTVASGYAEKLGFSSFSKFGIGTAPLVLPIELLTFDAHLNGDKVEITWATRSEINNNYFVIEKSTNGKEFKPLAKINGAGTTSEQHTYMDVDYDLIEGKMYYRLKQVDFDNNSTYSEIVAVSYIGNKGHVQFQNDVLMVYPNPSNGGSININIKNINPEEQVLVAVRDITGKVLYSKVYISDFNGEIATAFDPHNLLPNGTYLIIGSVDNRLFSKTLIVN